MTIRRYDQPFVQTINNRDRYILSQLNMNNIPSYVPNNMKYYYMRALEYGPLMHGLPKNLAYRLMHYRDPMTIYRVAQSTKMGKNVFPNLSYNDAFVLSHISQYLPVNTNSKIMVNSYKTLRRRGYSPTKASMILARNVNIKKHNASNLIKYRWKKFKRAMKPGSPTNPQWRAKVERIGKSANRSFNRYKTMMRMGTGGGRRGNLMREIRYRVPRIN